MTFTVTVLFKSGQRIYANYDKREHAEQVLNGVARADEEGHRRIMVHRDRLPSALLIISEIEAIFIEEKLS